MPSERKPISDDHSSATPSVAEESPPASITQESSIQESSKAPSTSPALSSRTGWFLRCLAAVAAAISVYLLYVSVSDRGAPIGCGPGSPCAVLLSSRWSHVLGLPVSLPALLVYLGIFLASFSVSPRRLPESQRAGWAILLVFTGCLVAAAAWFIGIQLLVVHEICPWCMAAHSLGILIAGFLLFSAPWRVRLEPSTNNHVVNDHRSSNDASEAAPAFSGWGEPTNLLDADHLDRRGQRLLRPTAGAAMLLLGATLTASLALGQIAFIPSQGVVRLPRSEGRDTGPGANRVITLLDGQLELRPHQELMLGSPDAPKLLVVLFDYYCPHCRATHDYLVEAIDRYSGQIGVIMLPMPLDKDCNPTVDYTQPEFEHSCELARLALAVWRVDREAYNKFDSWLFENQTPPTLAEAEHKAIELTPPDKLNAALKRKDIDANIKRNINAFVAAEAEVLPVLMSPGIDGIAGRIQSKEKLFSTFEKELGVGEEAVGERQ